MTIQSSTHRWSAVLICAFLLAGSSGCPGMDDGDPVDDLDEDVPPLAENPYAADQFCVTLAYAHCDFQYDCCNSYERLQLAGFGLLFGFGSHSDKSECIIENTEFCEAFLLTMAESAEAGRIQWDEQGFRRCAEPMAEAAEQCDAETFFGGGGQYIWYGVDQTDEYCRNGEWASGTVDDGDLCYSAAECAGAESTCKLNTSDDPDVVLITAEGTCQPVPGPGAEGDVCDDEENGYVGCEDDLRCDDPNDDGVYECYGLGEEDDPCDWGDDCAEGFYCDYDDDLCHARKGLGEPCDYQDDACESDFCDYDFDAGEAVCLDKLADGEECFNSSQCASGYCDDSAEPEVCGDPLPDGAECSYDSECQGGLCSYDPDLGDDVCRKPGEIGDECYWGDDCVEGLSCYDDICSDPDDLGGGINYNYEICEG